MKIAIITSRYPKENQPYNHMFVHVRALYFKKVNEDVTVFVPSKERSNYTIDGINVICDSGKNIAEKLSNFDIAYLHLLNVYFPFRKDSGYFIYKKLLKLNIPVAMYIHGSEVFKYPKYMYDFVFSIKGIAKVAYRNLWHFSVMKGIVKELNNRAQTTFMFPSKWMQEVAQDNFSLKFNNYFVIPNGINTEHFKFNDNYDKSSKLLVIRPFDDNKYGVDLAIEVMKYLPENFTMEIYGKGSLQQKFENLIIENHLTERVFINNGFVSREELPSFLSNYGVFVATSRWDSQGVIMCEAMASGLLTCSNPVTAIPEFIKDSSTGILGSTSKEIAQKILHFTQNREVYSKITQQGRESMENIAVDIVGLRELNVLKSMVN